MDRPQLQHLADFLARTFSEFGLVHDYQALAELRVGTLWMDIRFGHTLFNGKELKTLVTPQRLRSGLDMELGGDAAILLEEATLKVRFDTELHDEQREQAVRWAHPTGRFISCKIHCRSRIGTKLETATGLHSETLEWPYPFHVAGGEEEGTQTRPSNPPSE
jgi:hypothetical protein